MAKAFHRGRKLLLCGNGGSATDAQHIAVEFMHPITIGRKALSAICLTNDMAMAISLRGRSSRLAMREMYCLASRQAETPKTLFTLLKLRGG